VKKTKPPQQFMRRLAESILRHRRLLLILIAIVTIGLGTQLPHLRTADDEDTWFGPNDSTLQNYKAFQEDFPGTHYILIVYKVNNPLCESELEYLSKLGDKLLKLPYATEVLSLVNIDDIKGTMEGLQVEPVITKFDLTDSEIEQAKERIQRNPFIYGNLIGRDWQTLALFLKVEIPEEEQRVRGNLYVTIARNIKRLLDEEARQTNRQFHFSSELIMDGEINTIIAHDIGVFFPLSLTVSFLVIYFLFRSKSAVGISLATVVIALIWTLGLMGLCDVPISPVSATLFALINIIGLANAIHLLSQLRIELAHGQSRIEAVLRAFQIAGKPCFFTSLTTAVGFGSLVVSHIPAIRHLGYFASFGIMAAYILALIIVPVVSVKPNFGFDHNDSNRLRIFQNLLSHIADFNLRYPRLILWLNLIIILIMAGGIPLIKTEASLLEYLKKSSRLYQDTHFIDRNLTGVSSIEVIIHGRSDDFKEPDNLRRVEQLQQIVKKMPNVAVTYSGVDLLQLINCALNDDRPEMACIPATREAIAQNFLLYEISGGSLLEDYLTSDYATARVAIITKQSSNEYRQQLLQQIRQYVSQAMSEFKVTITGVDYLVNEVTRQIVKTQINSLILAFGIIILLMIAQFGLRGGLVSLIPNIFPIVLTLGLMGYGGFHLNMATAIIASIAIGIVVDDTIHYFSHFKAEYQQRKELPIAMRGALLEVGPALIFASMVLVLGFIIQMFSQTSILLDFGILSSIAILTALCGDLFIGPVLLSRWRVFPKPQANNIKSADHNGQ